MTCRTKRYIVELVATETAVFRRQIVVEVPDHCSEEIVEDLEGVFISKLADENGCKDVWQFAEHEGDFEVRSNFECGQATDLPPEVELTFDQFGRLAAPSSVLQIERDIEAYADGGDHE